MANLLTLTRFLLLFVLVGMAYFAPPAWQLANPFLLILIIALDGIDGYVARKRSETSLFGSMFDIAVDRVVENVLWIVLADLNLIPIWVAIVFITRSLMVDSIRSQAAARGKAPFAIMKSAIGKFLVAGRFMRGFYGTVKAVTFAWILLIQPWPALFSKFWNEWSPTIAYVTDVLIYFSVAICLLRGIPVIVEAYMTDGGLIRNNRIRGSR